MLRREESNKILKYTKAIFFASALFLLNPLSVSANENISNEQETLDINKENMDDCIVLCGAVLMIRGWMYLSDREKKQKEEETCERISSKKYVKKIEKNGGSYERI